LGWRGQVVGTEGQVLVECSSKMRDAGGEVCTALGG
jgi:hypothetical protein